MIIRKRLIVTMMTVIAVILSMTGCDAEVEPTAEPTAEPTVEPTVEPTAEPEEVKVYARFYNDESGDSNGEIYEIALFNNIEEALDHKSEINVGVENYPKMLFGETDWCMKMPIDPFTGETIFIKGKDHVGNRDILSDLTPIQGKFVALVWKKYGYGEEEWYAVVKIQ